MSRHFRFGFAAVFLVAGFTNGFSTPATANAFTDFFSLSSAPSSDQPAAAAPAAPAKDDCLSQPGEQAAAGQHWVYRYDGHRKCWFQAAAEDAATAKKPAHHRAARHSAAASDQDTSTPPKQKEQVEDARAEMASPAPAEAPQPTPSAPKLTIVKTVKVVDAAPGSETVAAAQVPPAPVLASPVLASPGADQLTSDQLRRHVDVETLLADAPAASDEVASGQKATPVAAPVAGMDGGADWMTSWTTGWMPNWLGALLMTLGGVALLSSSRTFRQALRAARSLAAFRAARALVSANFDAPAAADEEPPIWPRQHPDVTEIQVWPERVRRASPRDPRWQRGETAAGTTF